MTAEPVPGAEPASATVPFGATSQLPAVGTLRLPARIHVGYGTRAQLPVIAAIHGRRVLAVVDPFLTGTPFYTELIGGMTDAGLDVRVYSDITPELPVGTLDAAGRTARDFGPDVIVAIGGGSALDAAKLIALLAAHGGPLAGYYGENLVPGPVVPIVALPTTAGTGSEVTPVAVVSDPARELKVGISSPFLVPAAAIVDPELTLAVPASVTAFSGIDALVHAVESYTAREFDLDLGATLPVFTGQNALIAPIALRAAAHLGPWLPRAVEEPGNRQARHEVALGALLGGIAFGATGTHLCHAVQYPLGALTKTPHGLGTGLMLPYVLDTIRDAPGTAARIADLDTALGGPTRDRVVEINRRIGVPATLADLGVTRDQLPHIAELALASKRLIAIAPVDPEPEILLDLLHRAFEGVLR
ncbi:iron-containing alcohol dehydrogenase [Catenuloplanes japonicus]|uniref:iron-containing alcohol dehydrogenase n=1 Tax=Catenuloplanes japonicus TaxID=33876 RepID=UPI00068F10C1|nr:iron-containing alcohol dehydrogenase [Catenuloplanes japonicus]